MSEVHICDRCGTHLKEISPKRHLMRRKKEMKPPMKLLFFLPSGDYVNDEIYVDSEIDLCESCRNSFDIWFDEIRGKDGDVDGEV